MAPIQNYQQGQNDVPEPTIDWHMSEPQEIDLQQQHPLLRAFHEFCAITKMGSQLRTISKRYNHEGQYIGFLECSLHLPEDFIGKWCRLFYRGERTYVFVMSQNNQDFAIIDFEHGTTEGCWTLFDALPDGAFLQAIETQLGDESYRIIYTLDDNEHFSMEYGFGFPIQGDLAIL